MPTVVIPASPLAPGLTPVPLHVRDENSGAPLLILHGGWDYGWRSVLIGSDPDRPAVYLGGAAAAERQQTRRRPLS